MTTVPEEPVCDDTDANEADCAYRVATRVWLEKKMGVGCRICRPDV